MSSKKKAIVSVTNDLYTDQRVNKVCLFLLSQGYNVILVGRRRKNSLPLADRSYTTKRIKLLFETGALFYAAFNIRLFFFLLFKKCDVLVSNDLDTLLANSWAKKFKRNCKLVYDSHEYFTEVPELINRPKVQNIWRKIEKKYFPKADKVITVNESIASIYRKEYNRDIFVVRNISNQWKPQKIDSKTQLDIPENTPLIILQGAGINIDRGSEELIEAMPKINAVLMIVGDGDVVETLKNRVKELNIAEKVVFYGKKPYDVMMNYTYHADLGVTLDKPTNLNYKFSLPNKVFDYMHTTTPIIATDIIEVSRVIKKYDIGEILPQLHPEALAQTINSVLSNPERLNKMKTNCVEASTIENWEKETDVLKEVYSFNAQ